jgi:hypothetical protein
MASLFGGSTPQAAPAPVPVAPTLSSAQVDANAATATMLRADAVGQEGTVLTQGISSQQTASGKSTLLGGTQ